MPNMYRPNGVIQRFNNIEEGEKAGFFATFSEMAASCRKALDNPAVVESGDDSPPQPPVVVNESDAPQPHPEEPDSEEKPEPPEVKRKGSRKSK